MIWDAEAVVRGELVPGETVRWVGAPSFLAMLLSQLPLTLFGFVFASIPLSGTWTAWRASAQGTGPANPLSLMIPVLFSGIGLLMAISSFRPIIGVRRIIYAATSRRVLVIHAFRTRTVKAVAINAIISIDRSERGDGSGRISFRYHTVSGGRTLDRALFPLSGSRMSARWPGLSRRSAKAADDRPHPGRLRRSQQRPIRLVLFATTRNGCALVEVAQTPQEFAEMFVLSNVDFDARKPAGRRGDR